MSLLKTSLFNGVAVAVKIGSGLVTNKILAVYAGPGGYALIGQLQSVISIALSVSGASMVAGVTSETAANASCPMSQHAVWKTAARFSLLIAVGVSFGLAVFSEFLAESLLLDSSLAYVFMFLAVALPAMAMNSVLIAIANGKKETSIYTVTGIVGSLLGLAVTGVLVLRYGIVGALLSLSIAPAIAVLATAILITRRQWFRFRYLWGSIERSAVRRLSGFMVIGLTAAIIAPTTTMLIRHLIVTELGQASAGLWQATWKISEIYLMLITTTLSAYYLPRLGEITNSNDLRAEIAKLYKFCMPLAIIGATLIYMMRDFVVSTLFTMDFHPMRDLFKWQLVGDVIKIAAWVFGYILLGRGMVRQFVFTEIFFSLMLLCLTSFLVGRIGLEGACLAYAINYLLYWCACMYLVRAEMIRMDKGDITIAPTRGG